MKKSLLSPALLLLLACFDAPIKDQVELDRTGTVIDRTIRFKHSDRYAVGFSFRPTFVTGDTWKVSEFEKNELQAWSEVCAAVRITIADSANHPRMNETSTIAKDSGWSLTNGSQDGAYPASVYEFLPFTPIPGEKYRLTVAVVRPCTASRTVSPRFFIERPMPGP